jgi:hypothetical protein
MLFINRHSFLVTGVLAIIFAGLLSAALGVSAIGTGVIVCVVVGGFVFTFYRMGAGGSSHTRSQPVLDLIGGGTSVLVMFQIAY